MDENATQTPLQALQAKLGSLQTQLAEFIQSEEFWQFSLDGLNAMPDGEDKEMLESKRQHFEKTLADTKRERLSLQLWISSVERQIQALQQQSL